MKHRFVHVVCGRSFRSERAYNAHLPCTVEEKQIEMLREVSEHNRQFAAVIGDRDREDRAYAVPDEAE